MVNIPEDKRDKIIAAAIDEFAARGYEKASTNAITSAAGISKGLLFHYYGSKKRLFLWLVGYSLELALEYYQPLLGRLSPDLGERLVELGMEKLKFYREHPALVKFTAAALMNPPQEVKPEMHELEARLRKQNAAIIFKDLDMTGLKQDINQQRAMELMLICLEGLGAKYRKKYEGKPEAIFDDFDLILTEMKEYMDLLKQGVYKEGHE